MYSTALDLCDNLVIIGLDLLGELAEFDILDKVNAELVAHTDGIEKISGVFGIFLSKKKLYILEQLYDHTLSFKLILNTESLLEFYCKDYKNNKIITENEGRKIIDDWVSDLLINEKLESLPPYKKEMINFVNAISKRSLAVN